MGKIIIRFSSLGKAFALTGRRKPHAYTQGAALG